MRHLLIASIAIFAFTIACKKNTSGDSLFSAAAKGDTAMVRALLAEGADPNMSDPADAGDNPDYAARSALEAAIDARSVECAELLLDKGARIQDLQEALHRAVFNEKCDIALIHLLVERGAEINRVDMGGDTPLNLAVRRGNIEVVEYLISKKARYTDGSGRELGAAQALIDARAASSRTEDPLSFTGSFTNAELGFEGSDYYITLKNNAGAIMRFRATENPEIAYFITSPDTGMPVLNRELLGDTFTIYYRSGTETDARGETVRVNEYIHSETKK